MTKHNMEGKSTTELIKRKSIFKSQAKSESTYFLTLRPGEESSHRTEKESMENINCRQLCFVSKISTNHFQKGLKKLPIPPLDLIAAQLFQHVSNYTSPEELNSFKQIYESNKKDLIKLHRNFVKKSGQLKRGSLISEIWENEAFLRNREPLTIYQNPMLMLSKNLFSGDREQLASKLIVNSLRVYKSYREDVLAPDIAFFDYNTMEKSKITHLAAILPPTLAKNLLYSRKMYPLDMTQYKRLFATTRIPQKNIDCIKTFENSKHIVVLINGTMFKVTVIDENDLIISQQIIQNTLKVLVDLSKEYPSPHIGNFTNENRDRWAKIREMMENTQSYPSIKDNLIILDSALFVVCLDHVETDKQTEIDLCKHFLYQQSHNRWFDKSFQIIVDNFGNSGIIFEHSARDGYPIMMLIERISKLCDEKNDSIFRQGTCNHDILFWNIKTNVTDELSITKQNLNLIEDSVVIQYIKIPELNRKFLKINKYYKPDAIIQLAFQIAYFSTFSRIPNVFEAAATINFAYGRTENLRPVSSKSVEAVKFYHNCVDLLQNSKSANIFRNILMEASKLHSKAHLACLSGKGMDRILFALEWLSREEKEKIQLFKTQNYQKIMGEFDLITSTLKSKYIPLWAFGPIKENGIAIAYMSDENETSVCLTYFKSLEKDMPIVKNFAKTLEEVFHNIFKILTMKS